MKKYANQVFRNMKCLSHFKTLLSFQNFQPIQQPTKNVRFHAPNITIDQLHRININNTQVQKHLVEDIMNADIIVTNQGLHYGPLGLNKVHLHFDAFGQFLFHQTRSRAKTVVVRSTTPQHYFTKQGSGLYEERITGLNICDIEVTNPRQHSTNYLLMEMAVKYNFKYLDNFPIYYQRGDLPPGRKMSGRYDCTHHCYTPEVIWPELVLLTELIT